MACFVLRGGDGGSRPGSILKKILIIVCVLVGSTQIPAVWAQRSVPHAGGVPLGGGARMAAPPRTAIPPRPVFGSPRGAGQRGAQPRLGGTGAGNIRFVPRPAPIFGHRFFGRRFFLYPVNSPFLSIWWPSCGPGLGWGFGIECFPQPSYTYGLQNYVTLPAYEAPVYVYGEEDRAQVWLYMKDGKVHPVNDYWFVDEQMHFTEFGEDPLRPVEHVVAKDELDVQKTATVNSARGFRMVVRDEPWRQYLKDHPDTTPPELLPQDKN
jgi:hypothetical protein